MNGLFQECLAYNYIMREELELTEEQRELYLRVLYMSKRELMESEEYQKYCDYKIAK